MNTSLIKSALAMTAAFAVGSALATEEQIYGATFENTANGNYNDYGYTVGDSITNSAYYQGGVGWKAGSADDASQIISGGAATGTQALKLQTEGGTLTNVFSSTVMNKINAARETENTKVVFEAQVKFVASDNLDCGVNPAEDQDAKFALYAYAPDGGSTTNLVIFHKDGSGTVTNDVITGITINTEEYTPIVVNYFTYAGNSLFSVKAGDVQATSDSAYDFEDGDGAIWFFTLNDSLHSDISSLCFKGTGEVDDISIKSVVEEEEEEGYVLDVTIDEGVASVTITDSASVAFVTDASTNFTGVAAGEATIAITYDDWYVAAGTYENGDTIDISADVAIEITATKATSPSGVIDAGAFTNANAQQMSALVDWAVANGKTVDQVEAMTFANALNPTADEKSFLLGTGTAGAITEEAAIDELEIVSIEYVNGEWVVTTQGGADGASLGNGHIDIFGATTLAGPWAPDIVGAKFFKAVLVK